MLREDVVFGNYVAVACHQKKFRRYDRELSFPICKTEMASAKWLSKLCDVWLFGYCALLNNFRRVVRRHPDSVPVNVCPPCPSGMATLKLLNRCV